MLVVLVALSSCGLVRSAVLPACAARQVCTRPTQQGNPASNFHSAVPTATRCVFIPNKLGLGVHSPSNPNSNYSV